MERILCHKLLSETLKNLSSKTHSFSSKTFPFLSKPTNAGHQQHGIFSRYTTWSSGQQNQGFSDKIPFGFFSNPVFAKRLLQSTTLKGKSKGLFDSTVGFFRVQISRRNFHSNFSFDSNSRRCGSGFQRHRPGGVILGLLLTNVGVFMLWRIANFEFMKKNFMISMDNFTSGRIHTLVTYAFSHIKIHGLLEDMFWLCVSGTFVGRWCGPKYLLKLYLAGAVAGSVFFLMHKAYLSSKGTRVEGTVFPSKFYALGAGGSLNAIVLLNVILLAETYKVTAIILGIFLVGGNALITLRENRIYPLSTQYGGYVVAVLAWLQLRKRRFRL